jgi:hypothetical protein
MFKSNVKNGSSITVSKAKLNIKPIDFIAILCYYNKYDIFYLPA